MDKKELNKLAKNIFKAIEDDLRGRRGIKHEWEQVDKSTQKEIRETNIENITTILEKRLK